jgi:hypothetical protein
LQPLDGLKGYQLLSQRQCCLSFTDGIRGPVEQAHFASLDMETGTVTPMGAIDKPQLIMPHAGAADSQLSLITAVVPPRGYMQLWLLDPQAGALRKLVEGPGVGGALARRALGRRDGARA